jgi:hypothetical protein
MTAPRDSAPVSSVDIRLYGWLRLRWATRPPTDAARPRRRARRPPFRQPRDDTLGRSTRPPTAQRARRIRAGFRRQASNPIGPGDQTSKAGPGVRAVAAPVGARRPMETGGAGRWIGKLVPGMEWIGPHHLFWPAELEPRNCDAPIINPAMTSLCMATDRPPTSHKAWHSGNLTNSLALLWVQLVEYIVFSCLSNALLYLPPTTAQSHRRHKARVSARRANPALGRAPTTASSAPGREVQNQITWPLSSYLRPWPP